MTNVGIKLIMKQSNYYYSIQQCNYCVKMTVKKVWRRRNMKKACQYNDLRRKWLILNINDNRKWLKRMTNMKIQMIYLRKSIYSKWEILFKCSIQCYSKLYYWNEEEIRRSVVALNNNEGNWKKVYSYCLNTIY